MLTELRNQDLTKRKSVTLPQSISEKSYIYKSLYLYIKEFFFYLEHALSTSFLKRVGSIKFDIYGVITNTNFDIILKSNILTEYITYNASQDKMKERGIFWKKNTFMSQLYTYEFWLSLYKIVRSSGTLLLPLFECTHLWKKSIMSRPSYR